MNPQRLHIKRMFRALVFCGLIVLLVTTNNVENWEYFIHCSPYPLQDKTPCKVGIHGKPRSNPRAKDSNWIKFIITEPRDRKYIEEQKSIELAEMIIHDEDNLYEGLITNFGVIQVVDGMPCLITAPFDLVLKGIGIKLVLEACDRIGLAYRLQCPSLQSEWKECFIVNGIKGLRPVREVVSIASK